MQHLYLLRHGIAVPPGMPDVDDDDRHLTEAGERRTRQVAFGLRKLKPKLDRIATSPLPRALRTAEIVAQALGSPELVEQVDALRAGVSAASVREWLATREEARLMVVGHDPWISGLLAMLIGSSRGGGAVPIRKAGLAVLKATPEGEFTLEWMARPRLFRRLMG